MKKITIFIFILFLGFPFLVNAVCTGGTHCDIATTKDDCEAFGCDWTTAGGGVTSPITLKNPFGAAVTPQTLIGRIINATMGLVGSLALAMFIYGGFTWMIAAGNEQNVQKGKDILTWATIGLIVIFSSYAMVNLLFKGMGVT